MKYQYQHLVICITIKPDSHNIFEFHSEPSKLNKWLDGWLTNLLVEDYDDLELSHHSIGFYLIVPIKHIKPDIVGELEPDTRRSDKRINTLLSLAKIKEDEFKITDCYLI